MKFEQHKGTQRTQGTETGGYSDEDGSDATGTGNFIQTFTSRLYRFFIDEGISAPNKYRILIQTLLAAEDGDVIEIMLNTDGGRLDSTAAIIEGIRSCEGHVRAVILSACHSAGSMLALSCDEIVVLDSAEMMIHTASYGSVGKSADVLAHTAFMTKKISKLVESCYEGFLTSTEIQSVLAGREIWMDSEEIRQRLKNRNLHFKEIDDAENEVVEVPKKAKKKTKST